MISPLSRLTSFLVTIEPQIVVDNELAAWIRARDLVIGFVSVTGATAEQRINKAYDLLDDSGALQEHELWSVVLLIEVDEPLSLEAERICRELARDLRRSRKLPFSAADKAPMLFSALDKLEAGIVANWPDPIAGVLETVDPPALREALQVLLRSKRDPGDVDILIARLGEPEQ